LVYDGLIGMNRTANLVHGSIDMHIHASPDPRVQRSVNALDAAQQAHRAGMAAIVLKSHEYPTAPLASIINEIVPEIKVFGSISLDYEVGGLNTFAIEASAKMGAKVVWMPTRCSDHDMKRNNPPGSGISIMDNDGKLLPIVDTILEIVKSHNMVLATGHISQSESFALVDRARQHGIWKIVTTHPLLEKAACHLSLEEQSEIAKKGAFIEHCINDIMPMIGLHPGKMVEAVKIVGAEHCILSSDLGQIHNPVPVEGMRAGMAILRSCGLSDSEITLMTKVNPAKLLDL